MTVNKSNKPPDDNDDKSKENELARLDPRELFGNDGEAPLLLPEDGEILSRDIKTARKKISEKLTRLSGRTGKINVTRRINAGDESTEKERKKRIEQMRMEDALPEFFMEMLKQGTPNIKVLGESSHLFCDQTNFTGVSELMKKVYRRESGQKISELINGAISASIDEVKALGGDIIQFGGDAVQVLFTGPKHRERATLAGIMIQKNLQKKLEKYHTDPIKIGSNIHYYLLPPEKKKESDLEKSERKGKRDILDTIDKDIRSDVNKKGYVQKLVSGEEKCHEEILTVYDEIDKKNLQIVCKTTYSQAEKTLYREYALPLKDHARPESPKFNATHVVATYSYHEDKKRFTEKRDISFKIKRRASIGVHTGTAFASISESDEKDQDGKPIRYNFQVTGPGVSKMTAVEAHARGETVYVSEEMYKELQESGFAHEFDFEERELKENGVVKMKNYEVIPKDGINYDALVSIYKKAELKRGKHPDEEYDELNKCFEPVITKRIKENSEPILDRFFTTFIKIPSVSELEAAVGRGEKSPEELLAVQNKIFDIIHSVVRGYDGILNKFDGSSGLIIFWPPEDNEVNRSIDCANDMYTQLKETGFISYIGIEQGENLFGPAGQVTPDNCEDESRRRMEITCIGDAVNTAARYAETRKKMESAKPEKQRKGGVFYGKEVMELSSMESGEKETVQMKGKEGAVDIYRAMGRRKKMPHRGELIGHEEYAQKVRTFLSSEEDSRFLIQGAEGSGKSRLIFECKREVEERRASGENICFFETDCDRSEREKPFAPFVSIIHKLYADALDDILADEKTAPERMDQFFRSILQNHKLACLTPIICKLLLPAGITPKEELVMDQADLNERIQEIIIALLDNKSNENKLVVALDDVHYADESSFAFIKKLEEHAFKNPLLLVVTSLMSGKTPVGREPNKACERMVAYLTTGIDPETKESDVKTEEDSPRRKISTENYTIHGLEHKEIAKQLLRRTRFQSQKQAETPTSDIEVSPNDMLPSAASLMIVEKVPQEIRREILTETRAKFKSTENLQRSTVMKTMERIKKMDETDDTKIWEDVEIILNAEYTEPNTLINVIAKKCHGNPLKAIRLFQTIINNSKCISTRLDANGNPICVLSDETLTWITEEEWERYIGQWLDETLDFKRRFHSLNIKERGILYFASMMPDGFTIEDLEMVEFMGEDMFPKSEQRPIPEMDRKDIRMALARLERKGFLGKSPDKRFGKNIWIMANRRIEEEMQYKDKTMVIPKEKAESAISRSGKESEHIRGELTQVLARSGEDLQAANKESRHLAAAYLEEEKLRRLAMQTELLKAMHIHLNIEEKLTGTEEDTARELIRSSAEKVIEEMDKKMNDFTKFGREQYETLNGKVRSILNGQIQTDAELKKITEEIKSALGEFKFRGKVLRVDESIAKLHLLFVLEILGSTSEENMPDMSLKERLGEIAPDLEIIMEDFEDSLKSHDKYENYRLEHFRERTEELRALSFHSGTDTEELKIHLNSLMAEISASLAELPDEKKEVLSSMATHYDKAVTKFKKTVSAEDSDEEAVWLEELKKKARNFVLDAAKLHAGSVTAEAFYDMHLKYVEKADTDEYYDTMYWRAVAQALTGRRDMAKEEFEKLYQVTVEYGNKKQQARIMNAKSEFMEWEEKLVLFQEVLLLSLESENSEFIFVSINNLITTCLLTEAYEEALKLTELFEILYSLLETGNSDENLEINSANSIQKKSRIGEIIKWCLTELTDYKGRIIEKKYLENTSLPLFSEDNSVIGHSVIKSIRNTTMNLQSKRLAQVKSRQIRLNLALGILEKYYTIDASGKILTTEIFENFAGSDEKRNLHFILGELLERKDEHEIALDNARQGLNNSKKSKNLRQIMYSTAVYARSLIFCNKIQDAIILLEESISILKQAKLYNDPKLKLATELAHSYQMLKKYDTSLEIIVKYKIHELNDIGKVLYAINLHENGETEKAREIYLEIINAQKTLSEKQKSMVTEKTFLWVYLKQLKSRLEKDN